MRTWQDVNCMNSRLNLGGVMCGLSGEVVMMTRMSSLGLASIGFHH